MKSKLSFLALIILLSFCIFPSFSQQKCFRVGIMADMNMFTNLFTQNGGWSASVPSDTDGYPLAIPSGTTSAIQTIMSTSGITIWQDSVYVIRWDGDGNINVINWIPTGSTIRYNSQVEGLNGRIEFKVHYVQPWSTSDWMQVNLQITSSLASNHIRNIRVYLKTFETAYETKGQIINPYYLARISTFTGAIRMMGILNINGSTYTSWADHTTPTYYNQSGGQNGAGPALEWLCLLCNLAKKDMYFNVPAQADNNSIQQMAKVIYQNLNPNLNVYLEYSNETWNWGFDQSFFILNYANEYCGGDWMGAAYAHFALNMFQSWRGVFGRDSLRVKRVVATQTVSDLGWVSEPRADAVGWNNFDVWAPTYYLTGDGQWPSLCSTTAAIDTFRWQIEHSGSSWYTTMTIMSNFAKMMGKELYCYEGGVGCDPAQHTSYQCPDTLFKLQTDPRMAGVNTEIYDTLASMGFNGGNELSLIGSLWEPVANGLQGFWGLMYHLTDTVPDCPKYTGVTDYTSMHNCNNNIKSSDTIGSGMAIRLNGIDNYVDASVAYKPNDASDNYTIENWIRPEYLGSIQYLWSMAENLNPGNNNLYISSGNRIEWVVRNNAGVLIDSLQGPLVEIYKWYHILTVKSGNTYSLYVNGVEKATGTGNVTGNCSRSRMILGAFINNGAMSLNFRGRIDEFRIWNTAITNESTIRDWMCRKIKGGQHPDFKYLQAYYRFDIVDLSGVVKDQFGSVNAQLYNVAFSEYSNYMTSGAPIGDNSQYNYPGSWSNASLTYNNTNGDWLMAYGLGYGNPDGVQIYLVNQKPFDDTLPSTAYTSIGSYYYGVFTANGTPGIYPTYKVIYHYAGNPGASAIDANNRLLKRNNNMDGQEWQSTGAILDALAKTLSTRGGNRDSHQGEYIIGQRPSLDRNMPGPGYALHFRNSAYATMSYVRPDSEYTVSCWYKNDPNPGDGVFVSFSGAGFSLGNPDCSSFGFGYGGQLMFKAVNGWGNGSVQTGCGDIIDQTGWNHVAIIKKNDVVTVYLNGIEECSVPCGLNSSGQARDADFVDMNLGYGFSMDAGSGVQYLKGSLDEVQVWDTAFDINTLRQWMCRKVTNQNPYQENHLLLYYNFDEGSGTLLENRYGPGDLNIVGDANFIVSGAPIGDTSVYLYAATMQSALDLKIVHPNGDSLSFSKPFGNNNNMFGAHLYMVYGTAQFSTIPDPPVLTWDSTRYWGVYPISVGYNGANPYSYTVSYNCLKNKNLVLANEANTRFLNRMNNASAAWNLNNAPPAGNVFTDSYSTASAPGYWEPYASEPQEFIFGAINANAIKIDTAVPAQPGAITGLSTVCSGSSGLIYSVAAVSGATGFVWSLPTGMSGYSDSSVIIVSVAPDDSGNIGNISVYAINTYGGGKSRSLAITVDIVPSLSVNISGPEEVCSGQSANYSIAAVPGCTGYTWTVTPDGMITEDNQASIKMSFGTQPGKIDVYGTFGCGQSLINTLSVTVDNAPQANLNILGGNACSGVDTSADIIIKSSEIGVQYQAYKNGGTAPVGLPVIGTGSDLIIQIPLSELLPGSNVITVNAIIGGCAEVNITTTPTITVNVYPNANMPVSYDTSVCKGANTIITFPEGLAGMQIFPTIISYWRVDDAAVKITSIPYLLTTTNKSIAIPPSPFNNQMSSGGASSIPGLNIGENRISFTVVNGTCPPVALSDTILIDIPNEPRQFDYRGGAGCCLGWWIFTGDPWKPIPDTSKWIGTSFPGSTCKTDTTILSVVHAENGITYYARLGSATGPVVSDSISVSGTNDKSTIDLKIPPQVLPQGSQNICIMAKGSVCDIVLNSASIKVNQGVDSTVTLLGSTVCLGSNGTITVQTGQNNAIYELYQGAQKIDSVTGNGSNNAVLTVPAADIPVAGQSYPFTVKANYNGCSTFTFGRKPIINVITTLDVNNTIKLAYDVDTICKGLDDSVIIMNAQVGVSYLVYVNGDSIGNPAIGTGDDLYITLPYTGGLDAYPNQTVTITVKATAGTCADGVQLAHATSLYVNNNVNLTDESVKVNMNTYWQAGGEMGICPTSALVIPTELNGVTTSEFYLTASYTQNQTNDSIITGVSGTASGTYYNLIFNNTSMPRGSQKYLTIYAKEKGCPLHPVMNFANNNNNNNELIVFPGYDMNPPVIPDTVCTGDIATIGIYTNAPAASLKQADGPFDEGFQLINAGDTVVANSDVFWGTVNLINGQPYLELPINSSTFLHPGKNQFTIQESADDGACPYFSITSTGVVIVNHPPDQSLTVISESQCKGNGTAIIQNSQSGVFYQSVIGSSLLGNPVPGNNGNLTLSIDSNFLTPGTNYVGFIATIPGCATVTLNNTATIQIVGSGPSKPVTPVGPATVCAGETNVIYNVTLDPEALSYTWTLPPGATTASTSNSASVNFSTNGGNITVQSNNACGSSPSSAPLTVTITPGSIGGTLTGPASLCSLTSGTLTLTGATDSIIDWQYSVIPGVWKDTAVMVSALTFSGLTTTRSYRVVVSGGSCNMSYSNSVTISPQSGPKVNAGPDLTLSSGHDTTIYATVSGGSGNYTYLWTPVDMLSDPAVLSPNTKNITNTTQFILYVTDNSTSCTSSDTMTITIPGTTSLTVRATANPQIVCEGSSVLLTATSSGATGPVNYTWNNGHMGDTLTVAPDSTTTYTITANDGTGNIINQVTVTVNQPLLAGTSVSISVCKSSSSVNLFTSLGGTPAAGGNWTDVKNTGALTGELFNPSLVNTGTYIFIYTVPNIAPCEADSATVIVTVTASTIAGHDSTVIVCNNNNAVILQSYLYNAQTGGTWKDLDNTGSLSNGVFNATKVTPGSYLFRYIILSVQCGNDSATITITVSHGPSDTLTVSSVNVCQGTPVAITVMNAETGVTYTLEDSATLASVSPSDSTGNIQLQLIASYATVGTHTYLVSASKGGCNTTLAQHSQVVIAASPNPSITGATTVCPIDSGVQYNVTAQNNCRYQWTLTPSLSATIRTDTSNQVLVNFNGTSGNTLYVIVTDSISQCHNSDSLQITASDSAVPVIVCAKDIPVTANITDIVDNVYEYQVISNELQPISVKDNCGTVVLQNNYNNTDSIKAGTQIPINVAGSGNNFEKTILWTAVNEGQKEVTCEVSINVTINDKLQPMSAFSPNGDGVNENWVITNIERYPDATVQVFNRLGELVFESKSNYNNDWDGSNLPVDSYHYVITQNGKMLCRGIVTIIR